MIDFKNLEEAAGKTEAAFETLLGTYEKLPETSCNCDTIGICCVSLPEMTVLEALLWIDGIGRMPVDLRTALLKEFVYFYLTNPIRRPGCPFCMEGSCTIYTRRPFACRAYGLWSQKMGREQTRENRENQKAMVRLWDKFGVDIPPESLINEMDYCLKVTTKTPAKVSDKKLLKVLEEVYLLSKPMADLQQAFENVYQSDFSFLMASLLLGHKKAFLGKYAVIKEMVTKETETRLDKFLNTVTEDSWKLNL
jgi:Fe-S-cluster containining protein